MNSIGNKICFTSFGESHGRAVGGVLDGIPANTVVDMSLIRCELSRRAGKDAVGVSSRAQREEDEVEWLSGVVERDGQWIALGTPIAFLLRNKDARSEDYAFLKDHFRPGHADYTYQMKYGIRDPRGGGRASARETASRVVAGTIVRQQLASKGIVIHARLVQVGSETDPARFDDYLYEIQSRGDTVGGVVECVVTGMPVGAGEPVFDKLQAHLAFAVMSINGCKGFEYGTGFSRMDQCGSELYTEVEGPSAASGGIEGGISNGLPLSFRCAFKPAATLRQRYKGRHDCCIAVRAVPVVEAMTALCLGDFLL